MNLVFRALVLSLLATVAYADSPTDQAFRNLADEYIADLGNFSPVAATSVGDHTFDDKLDDVDVQRAEPAQRPLQQVPGCPASAGEPTRWPNCPRWEC